MEPEQNSRTLEQIPADRRLVEELYAHGRITRAARQYALDLLYPREQWGLWSAHMLLTLGTALVLAGIIYFFAFNWAKIPPLVKLYSIQGVMVGCLVGACLYSLRHIGGQLFLLSASVSAGVFMAVFGQVYQTGADAYQLFMNWSLLILGWTLLSNFAAQWALWLVVGNLFLALWWDQVALPGKEMQLMIYSYLAILNGTALVLREYLVVGRGSAWPAARWTRLSLLIATLVILLPPMLVWIYTDQVTTSMILGGLLCLAVHAAAYWAYRHKLPDLPALAAAVLSACLIVEFFFSKHLEQLLLPMHEAAFFLFMGLLTLGIFGAAIAYLRGAAGSMRAERTWHA